MTLHNVPLQRVAGLSGAPALLRELGADPRDACAGLSFGPDDLQPDAMIPFGEAVQLLANCERVTGLEHFGLILGARHDHLSLGPIGQVMHVAPTLGDAIRDYIRVQIGLSRGAAVYSYPIGDDVAFGFGIYARHHPGVRQAYGFTMAVAANLVRALTGGKADLVEVLLCHRPPADPSHFERALGTRIRFDQYQSCVVFSRADLKRPNPNAHAARYEKLSAQLAAMMQVDGLDAAVLLRHRIKPLLMQGDFSLDAVARQLEMHPRTLNRRLLEGGTSFIAIRDEMRFRLAQELLALTDLPVGDIAAALSFSAHGNFVRAFRRWAGVTPTEWRSNAMTLAR
ncbi:AraC family transcriptional regulator ligand-binding domain-containing protein [Rhodoblastus sp.]|uniref:AraC family transcriptional regulator n=1 Tax=Rhodoblastus sp. TaxID=1962975 RepID=UPI0035B0F208